MVKTKDPDEQYDPLPELPDYHPKPADGVRAGESPVPGITLKRILRGHADVINRIVWSPEGGLLASVSYDETIRIWDVASGKCIAVFEEHSDSILVAAWSPDGQTLVSGTENGEVFFWDVSTNSILHKINREEDHINSLAFSPDGKFVAIGGIRDLTIWEVETVKEKQRLNIVAIDIKWSTNGETIKLTNLFIEEDRARVSWQLWNISSGSLLEEVVIKEGTTFDVFGPSRSVSHIELHENLIFVAYADVIELWDANTKKKITTVEGHTGSILSLSVSPDGFLLASKSADSSVRLWRCDTFQTISILEEPVGSKRPHWDNRLSFHPSNSSILVTLGESETVIRIWDIVTDEVLASKPKIDSLRYTTAKLVLVGDSGVGKTGLGWRLAHGEFKEHASTHGQQFWVIDELGKTRADGTKCEAVLWDLAGQAIYRHGHPLFLENVDLSLLLFDPTKGMESLNGVEFWINQLSGKDKLPPSVLVGARVDVGDGILTQDELVQFCQRYDISGGYVRTSAKKDIGLDHLLDVLKSNILWDAMTTTVTTVTFKRIKDYVLSLKEQPDPYHVLVSPAELREQLEAAWEAGVSPFDEVQDDGERADWKFTDAEMMTAVGHLENHGYIMILRTSAGEQTILLSPDLLVNLVSSIVLQACRHPRSLGSLNETKLLKGDYPFAELKALAKVEQETLSDAAILRFLEHNICFRETLGVENLLIFPGLIRQKRPLYDDVETFDDVSYIIRGGVENVYPALVVLLGYTQTFTRVNQWQNQAQYQLGEGEICGFRQIEERAGEVEIILYFSVTTPSYVRAMFQGLFEKFLYQRDVDVTRYPPVHCVNGHLQERATVIRQLRQSKVFIFCSECGEKVTLPKVEEPLALGERDRQKVAQAEDLAQMRRTYEMYLSRVKGFRRDRVAPRCYVSHLPAQKSWVVSLIADLRDAGIHVVDEAAQIEANDFILMAVTPAYKQAWQSLDKAIADDIALFQARLKQAGRKRLNVIPLLLEGDLETSRPRELHGVQSGNFQDETRHALELYDLVLTLYAIPFNHPAFEPLRQDLHRQWEDTLTGKELSQPEVFISYAWGGESEEIANELDQAFRENEVTIIRDKRNLEFKGRIKALMKTIGQGKCVILIISQKYLKSPNCMFELVQVAQHGDFEGRIFPVVLDDADIYDPVARLDYVKYWEQKITELDKAMKDVSAANLEGFRDDIDSYTAIRTHLPRLAEILKDMNTLTTTTHRESGFAELFKAVMAKLEE